MLILAVHLTVQSGKEDDVIPMFQELQAGSRREPGCITYIVQRSRENPRRYLVYEQYTDQAALDAHRISDDVEKAIEAQFPGADIIIHQDPEGIAEFHPPVGGPLH